MVGCIRSSRLLLEQNTQYKYSNHMLENMDQYLAHGSKHNNNMQKYRNHNNHNHVPVHKNIVPRLEAFRNQLYHFFLLSDHKLLVQCNNQNCLKTMTKKMEQEHCQMSCQMLVLQWQMNRKIATLVFLKLVLHQSNIDHRRMINLFVLIFV